MSKRTIGEMATEIALAVNSPHGKFWVARLAGKVLREAVAAEREKYAVLVETAREMRSAHDEQPGSERATKARNALLEAIAALAALSEPELPT